jgi:hypothetical protein
VNADDKHRRQRELLGSFALGHLTAAEATGLRAHLDGCPACRLELAELATLVPDLRGVSLRALGSIDTPPAGLGTDIVAVVAQERVLRDRRQRKDRARRRLARGLTAAAAAIAVLAVGLQVGRATAPQQNVSALPSASPSLPAIPMEPVRLAVGSSAISVQNAVLIPHTWGVEMKFVASGLEAGTVYRAWFVGRSGERMPAGEFLGVGAKSLKCNMQAALLRADTSRFVVVDPAGRTVLSGDLPA